MVRTWGMFEVRMNRRQALGTLGGGLLAVARPARLAAAPRRVVWFSTRDRQSAGPFLDALRAGVKDLGYQEGRDLVFEERWTDFDVAREAGIAAEIQASRPAVIVTQGRAARVMRALPPLVPVVFGFSGEPIEAGLAVSLARPGYNLTGITLLALDLVAKRVEVLKEVLPAVRRLGVVASPEHVGEAQELAASRAAADRFGIRVSYHPARNGPELDAALAAARSARAEALVIFPDPLTNARRALIAEFALRHGIPAVSGWSIYAETGLLLTYGPNLIEAWRRGAKPAELPIELPRTVELVVNQRTARALGVNIPPPVLVRADRVIE
jgi:putative ABC transport system substrate-binding protein